ncbi:MAG: hypothetical protein ACC726_17120 [Chloroflexota bacterium]
MTESTTPAALETSALGRQHQLPAVPIERMMSATDDGTAESGESMDARDVLGWLVFRLGDARLVRVATLLL